MLHHLKPLFVPGSTSEAPVKAALNFCDPCVITFENCEDTPKVVGAVSNNVIIPIAKTISYFFKLFIIFIIKYDTILKYLRILSCSQS